MLEQAKDYRDECEALFRLCDTAVDNLEQKTQFKDWTINDIFAHLHFFDRAADLSLRNSAAFGELVSNLMNAIKQGAHHLDFTHQFLNGLSGPELFYQWHSFSMDVADRFFLTDPKQRVAWLGVEMSARSSISARQMETWAHGQAIYDVLGVHRRNEDRIKNIVIMGLNTFAWCFINRQLDVPDAVPHLILEAPSGVIWEWNQENIQNSIHGKAEEFCQVVTQVRNIKDTSLQVKGDIAYKWMSIAQCFAGPAEEPPAVATRFAINEL